MKKITTIAFLIICVIFLAQTVNAAPKCGSNPSGWDPACWTDVLGWNLCTWPSVGEIHKCALLSGTGGTILCSHGWFSNANAPLCSAGTCNLNGGVGVWYSRFVRNTCTGSVVCVNDTAVSNYWSSFVSGHSCHYISGYSSWTSCSGGMRVGSSPIWATTPGTSCSNASNVQTCTTCVPSLWGACVGACSSIGSQSRTCWLNGVPYTATQNCPTALCPPSCTLDFSSNIVTAPTGVTMDFTSAYTTSATYSCTGVCNGSCVVGGITNHNKIAGTLFPGDGTPIFFTANEPGTLACTVTVVGSGGSTATCGDMITVDILPPSFTFSVSSTTVKKGETVDLTWNNINNINSCTAYSSNSNPLWNGSKTTASGPHTEFGVSVDEVSGETYSLKCMNASNFASTQAVSVAIEKAVCNSDIEINNDIFNYNDCGDFFDDIETSSVYTSVKLCDTGSVVRISSDSDDAPTVCS